MAIELEAKPPRIRMFAGTVYEVEAFIEANLDQYPTVTMNFVPVGDKMMATAIMQHRSMQQPQPQIAVPIGNIRRN